MTPEMIQTISNGAMDGFIAGMVPLLIGVYNNRFSLAVQGLLGTILLGMYAGWLLAAPGAVYSAWRIIHDSIVASDGSEVSIHSLLLRS